MYNKNGFCEHIRGGALMLGIVLNRVVVPVHDWVLNNMTVYYESAMITLLIENHFGRLRHVEFLRSPGKGVSGKR